MTKGKIVLISGPSGVGKKTVLDPIVNDDSLNIEYSISATTRPKRQGEVDGKDYFFLTKNEFEAWIKNDNFLEYAEFCGNYYGTPKQKIIEAISCGKNVLLEIEVVGAQEVLNKFSKDEIISIFLAPPSLEALKQRLLSRGTENLDIVNQRVKKAEEELGLKHLYQYVVVNENIESTIQELKEIIVEHGK